MKIGITGLPGSGKTTFAYYLSRFLPNCCLPNVDDIYYKLGRAKMMDSIGYRWATARIDKEKENQTYEYILNSCKQKGIEIIGDYSLEQKASYALSKLAYMYTNEYIDKEIPKESDFAILDFYMLPYLQEFCHLDYSVLLDVDACVRYNNSLERMIENEGRTLTRAERQERIKKMEEFEKRENLKYSFINYDLTLKNPPNLKVLNQEAKKLSLQILQNYSKIQIQAMLCKEYDDYVNLVVRYSNTLLSKSKGGSILKEVFGEALINKLFFLYKNELIETDPFRIFLEKYLAALKYYFNETKNLQSFSKDNIELSENLKNYTIKLYKERLVDKECYNKLISEINQLKKKIR